MSTRILISISEKVLRRIVFEYLRDQLGSTKLVETDVKIQVKSAQNYKSEWETAEFRATVDKEIP